MELKEPPRRVALIGLMGAGKSRVGHLVAAAAGWPFLDADVEAERESGRPVPRAFRREGRGLLPRAGDASLGGTGRAGPSPGAGHRRRSGGSSGEPGSSSGRRSWWSGCQVDPEEAARRLCGEAAGRCSPRGIPWRCCRRLAERRDPLYAETAHLTLRTGRGSHAEDLRDEVLDLLGVV